MKTFAVLSFLLALAAAKPVEVASADDGGSLAKRDTEMIYLVNCRSAVSCCTPDKHYSTIAYYAASAQSHNGETPATNNLCTVKADDYVFWEQGNPQCTFPTGVTFTAHIDSDAQTRPLYSWAGWGSNGYKNWNCYKDNGRKLYGSSGPEWANTCSSVYYCTPQ